MCQLGRGRGNFWAAEDPSSLLVQTIPVCGEESCLSPGVPSESIIRDKIEVGLAEKTPISPVSAAHIQINRRRTELHFKFHQK